MVWTVPRLNDVRLVLFCWESFLNSSVSTFQEDTHKPFHTSKTTLSHFPNLTKYISYSFTTSFMKQIFHFGLITWLPLNKRLPKKKPCWLNCKKYRLSSYNIKKELHVLLYKCQSIHLSFSIAYFKFVIPHEISTIKFYENFSNIFSNNIARSQPTK